MGDFTIRKGLNINMVGQAEDRLQDALSDTVVLQPAAIARIKPRMAVKEGETVQRGSVIFYDKTRDNLRFRSPVSGVVKSIVLGARRSLQQVHIQIQGDESTGDLKPKSTKQVARLSREKVLDVLLDTGLITLIQERPFSKIPDPAATPKSIFVNAAASAPLQADPAMVVRGQEEAFQTGLAVLARLTEGPVHLCELADHPVTKQVLDGVEIHHFSGPHPAGNTSTHIHRIDPILPGDTVWTARAQDVVQIGRLFSEGQIPDSQVVSLAGPGVKENARGYYRVRPGTAVSGLTEGRLKDEDLRLIAGHPLNGRAVAQDGILDFREHELCVLQEGGERRLMGWAAPGLDLFSHSPTFLSTLLRRNKAWKLNTLLHGGHRALVVTGWYDKVTPLDIMVDQLTRAVLAKDTDMAVKLGILETDPEDFALSTFICPSKMDIGSIIRQGLLDIEAEGL